MHSLGWCHDISWLLVFCCSKIRHWEVQLGGCQEGCLPGWYGACEWCAVETIHHSSRIRSTCLKSPTWQFRCRDTLDKWNREVLLPWQCNGRSSRSSSFGDCTIQKSGTLYWIQWCWTHLRRWMWRISGYFDHFSTQWMLVLRGDVWKLAVTGIEFAGPGLRFCRHRTTWAWTCLGYGTWTSTTRSWRVCRDPWGSYPRW